MFRQFCNPDRQSRLFRPLFRFALPALAIGAALYSHSGAQSPAVALAADRTAMPQLSELDMSLLRAASRAIDMAVNRGDLHRSDLRLAFIEASKNQGRIWLAPPTQSKTSSGIQRVVGKVIGFAFREDQLLSVRVTEPADLMTVPEMEISRHLSPCSREVYFVTYAYAATKRQSPEVTGGSIRLTQPPDSLGYDLLIARGDDSSEHLIVYPIDGTYRIESRSLLLP